MREHVENAVKKSSVSEHYAAVNRLRTGCTRSVPWAFVTIAGGLNAIRIAPI